MVRVRCDPRDVFGVVSRGSNDAVDTHPVGRVRAVAGGSKLPHAGKIEATGKLLGSVAQMAAQIRVIHVQAAIEAGHVNAGAARGQFGIDFGEEPPGFVHPLQCEIVLRREGGVVRCTVREDVVGDLRHQVRLAKFEEVRLVPAFYRRQVR